jgi:hypothetical protein
MLPSRILPRSRGKHSGLHHTSDPPLLDSLRCRGSPLLGSGIQHTSSGVQEPRPIPNDRWMVPCLPIMMDNRHLYRSLAVQTNHHYGFLLSKAGNPHPCVQSPLFSLCCGRFRRSETPCHGVTLLLPRRFMESPASDRPSYLSATSEIPGWGLA